MALPLRLLTIPALALAAISVGDPSDVIPPSQWTVDNRLVPDYNVPFLETQPSDIVAAYAYTNGSSAVDHAFFSVNENDTSVLLVASGSDLKLSYVDVVKFGHFSNLLEASFWGFNAAINVANASTAELDHVNVTVHNGAANIYAYGTDTIVKVSNSWLYSSGPVSHGFYASGNGTIIGRNIQHYSGGMRSSAFSGDNPSGQIFVYDSVSRVAGIGSATYYALGTIYAKNVISVSEKGPVVFMDGAQNATLINCNATAGLLGGVALFSSQVRTSGAALTLRDTEITTTGETMPGLWFGNIIVDVKLESSKLNTASGILVVANYSQITQDFDYYASYSDNTGLLPARVYATVKESALFGDLVAYNSSHISWSIAHHTSWTGRAYSGYGNASFDISLDCSSNWTLTGTTIVQNLTDSDSTMSNIHSGGHSIYYNASALLNGWLGGKTIKLAGGGVVTPINGSIF